MGIRSGFKRLIGFSDNRTEHSVSDRGVVTKTKRGSKKSHRPIEIVLNGLPYIPLPPSPPTWELRREEDEDYYRAYSDPALRIIIQAYQKKQYNKVVSLVETVPLEDRTGIVGQTFLKAYRNLIQRWRNKDSPKVALKWSDEMLEMLPNLVTDTDRRRHNKLVDELDKLGTKHPYLRVTIKKTTQSKEPRFTINDNCDWDVVEDIALAKADRPDPSFSEIHATSCGVLLLDSRGKAQSYPDAQATVRVQNQEGELIAEKGLNHDIYRASIPPTGSAFASLSSDCGLHVYTWDLKQIFWKNLISIGEKKNYIRCVDVSPSAGYVLYTVVDEAWCVDLEGHQRWAIKMPPKAGWQKITERVNAYGTSEEVDHALKLLGLSYPFEPDEIKQRFRQLAVQLHPDLHPNDPSANERMQQINSAYELLTGEDANIQLGSIDQVSYKKVIGKTRIEVPEAGIDIEFEISMGGPGEDWIYAASFASGCGAYIGSYSGRIVELDATGTPIRIYDIGCIPRRIVPINQFLYIVADTRLYVLKEGKLLRMIDIYGRGDLVFGSTGFGLFESNSFSWYTAQGNEVGGVQTNAPIRRIYPTKSGLAIETRTRRAIISGTPSWWSPNIG